MNFTRMILFTFVVFLSTKAQSQKPFPETFLADIEKHTLPSGFVQTDFALCSCEDGCCAPQIYYDFQVKMIGIQESLKLGKKTMDPAVTSPEVSELQNLRKQLTALQDTANKTFMSRYTRESDLLKARVNSLIEKKKKAMALCGTQNDCLAKESNLYNEAIRDTFKAGVAVLKNLLDDYREHLLEDYEKAENLLAKKEFGKNSSKETKTEMAIIQNILTLDMLLFSSRCEEISLWGCGLYRQEFMQEKDN